MMFLSVVIASCSPSLPSGVLDEDDMEDVLYDMHVAQSMYESSGNQEYESDIIALRASVLKKHNVSQVEWDSSYNYYSRNADKLHAIYMSLNDRIQNNLVALGGKVDGIQGAEADTSNVWNTEADFILMQQMPYSQFAYSIEPDSTFMDGDTFTLQFDVQFVFQDGYRDVAAVMAVYYDNDSIATQVTHVNSDGHGILTLKNNIDRLHVRQIRGYFNLCRNLSHETSDANATTLRFVAVRSVKLLHTHTEPPAKPKDAESVDSLRVDTLRKDSIKKTLQQ